MLPVSIQRQLAWIRRLEVGQTQFKRNESIAKYNAIIDILFNLYCGGVTLTKEDKRELTGAKIFLSVISDHGKSDDHKRRFLIRNQPILRHCLSIFISKLAQ